MPHFHRLSSEPEPTRVIPAILPGLYEAGLPYFDWLFGGSAAACATLDAWMRRPSSEVFVGRTTLLIDAGGPLGGVIALPGAELARCRAADALAAAAAAGSERHALVEKVRASHRLFPEVEADELYGSKLWVVPEARGFGHAKALCRELIERGARQGFRRFSLDVWADNKGAVRLYRSLGFEPASERTHEGMRYLRMVLTRAAAPTFQSLSGEPEVERFIPAVLPGVHEAGLPYFDWLFGGEESAQTALAALMARASSEVFVGRATLVVDGGRPVGGFIALSGAELARCRAADALAVAGAARSDRRAFAERVRAARGLFAEVEPDELYLSKIWVVPERRGSGYGAALAREYLESGVREGFRRFSLDVSADREGAIHLYRSLGFEQVSQGSLPDADLRYIRMACERSG